MIKKISKKAIYIMLLIITLLSSFQGIVSAVEINNAFIQYSHDCGYHLQYWHNNQWTYVITSYVEYTAPNGNKYPAYCLNSDRAGVSASLDYSVSISSVLDDDRIWRVITHGYPYDNMGLNNDDAFVATKHAIYSIINNRDVRSYYHGGDARGEAIVDKIEYLTNIGRYGTQTQNSANTFGTKIGGFTQFNDTYYAQEYSVSSNIEMSSYTVTAISGFPSNSYIGDVNGNSKTTFSAGEHFKVFVPKSEIKSNFSGTIALQSKCKTFPVFYGNSPSADLQNYAVCYDPYGDVQGITKLDVDVYKSTVKVHKVDEETKESIEGITFNAKYKDNGENIGDFKTDKNGNITINRLRPGTIVLTETASTKHYILNTTEFDVSVEFGDTKEIEITNQHKKGNLRVFKVDKDNNRVALGNVEFDLYSEEYQKVIGTYCTNVDGEIYVENLRTGDYKWIEKNTRKMV